MSKNYIDAVKSIHSDLKTILFFMKSNETKLSENGYFRIYYNGGNGKVCEEVKFKNTEQFKNWYKNNKNDIHCFNYIIL